jgi:hypothetical protein
MRTFKALLGVGLAASDRRGTMQRLVVILSAVTALAVSGVAAAPASAGTEVLFPGLELECTNRTITFRGATFPGAKYTLIVTPRTGAKYRLVPFTVWYETCPF